MLSIGYRYFSNKSKQAESAVNREMFSAIVDEMLTKMLNAY